MKRLSNIVQGDTVYARIKFTKFCRFLSADASQMNDPTIQHNVFFVHLENIKLSLLTVAEQKHKELRANLCKCMQWDFTGLFNWAISLIRSTNRHTHLQFLEKNCYLVGRYHNFSKESNVVEALLSILVF